MRLDAILFDHDGTLVSSEHEHLALWREIAERHGGTLTDDFYWENMLGVATVGSAKALADANNFAISAEELKEERLALTREYLKSAYFPQIEGADEVLRTFSKQVPLALVSAAQSMCLEATIKGHQWESYFQSVVSCDDVEHTKPSPDCYVKALGELGVEAQYCVALEDTETGLKAAVAAGIPTIAIRTIHSMGHDFSSAITVVNSLKEAAEWLDTVRS